jgi:hypothetical protein
MTARGVPSERESATDKAGFHLAKSRFSTADKQLSLYVMLQLRFPGTETFLAVFQHSPAPKLNWKAAHEMRSGLFK